jgi:hypothetical protein
LFEFEEVRKIASVNNLQEAPPMVSPTNGQSSPPKLANASLSIHELAHLVLGMDGPLETVWDIANRACDEYAGKDLRGGL